jgi:hypothetical protein
MQQALSLPPATTFPYNWIRVPQRSYDHGRKQWNFERLESISFSANGRPGINMRDALRKTFTGLDGRDDPVLENAAGAISCRLLVGLLRFPTRPLELNPSKVPWVSSQQQFVSGTSTKPTTLPRLDEEVEDSHVGLDEEPPADNTQQARPRGFQEARKVSQLYDRTFVAQWDQLHTPSQSYPRNLLWMAPSKIGGGLAKASCASTTCSWSALYLSQRGPSNQRSGSWTLRCHMPLRAWNERRIVFISPRICLGSSIYVSRTE